MHTNVINVLSLFNGLGGGTLALSDAGIKVDNYFSSEIDSSANKVANHNYPNTIQLGDVRNVHAKDLPKIDLLLGGSPCQGFSYAGKQLNFEDPRSQLFFEYARILNEIREINPDVKFLLENVNMKKNELRIISETLGIYPQLINSNLFSAQDRKRWYWCNISTTHNILDKYPTTCVDVPTKCDLIIVNILQPETEIPESLYIEITGTFKGMDIFKKSRTQRVSGCLSKDDKHNYSYIYIPEKYVVKTIHYSVNGDEHKFTQNRLRFENQKMRYITASRAETKTKIAIRQKPRGFNTGADFTDKSPTVTACSWEHNNHIVINEFRTRVMTVREVARLQTIPDWFDFSIVSKHQAYKMIGNGWTIKVISNFLKRL